MPQRTPGQFSLDLVETQCGTSPRIANLEAFERQRGTQTGPMRFDPADADRAIDRRAHHLLYIAAVAFDLGQDRIAQDQQQQGKGEVAQRCRPGEHAQQDAEPGVGSGQLAQAGKQPWSNGARAS
jgi:hypothetical protein